MRIAFLTCASLAGGHPDDRRVLPRAEALGLRIEFVDWTTDRAWTDFDAVVIRTPWDYQHDLPRFLSVLRTIEGSGVPLWNPSAVVEWNADKGYLEELDRRGVRIVPTVFAELESEDHLRALIAEVGGDGVVKPRVGASGEDTWRLSADSVAWGEAATALIGRDLLVQPFMSRILTEGETSLTVIDGDASHVFGKTPVPGEFRSQEEHGGRLEARVDPEFEAWALDLARSLPETHGLLYARVDGIRDDDGRWCLGELELIEPKLYFTCAPDGTADRLADAIASRLGAHQG